MFKVGAKWNTNSIIHSMTWGNKVSKVFREKVVEICMNIWPNHPNLPAMINGLMAVMYRETRGTFAAHQLQGYKSLVPRSELTKKHFENINSKGEKSSRAIGLIQFTQNALEQMQEFRQGQGFDKLHTIKLNYAKMSDIEQLEKVKKYFNMSHKKPKVPEDIYATVFAPDTVGLKNSTTMYKKGTEEYIANPGLDKDGNGIQKRELISEFYTSLEEGNKSGNIAKVTIEKDIKQDHHNSNIVKFDSKLSNDRKEIVSSKTIKIIENAATKSLNSSITITSTVRSPLKQAQAMYTNEVNGKHVRYKEPGRKVIEIYKNLKNKGESKDFIVKKMEDKIIKLSNEGQRVSRHCVSDEVYKKVNTVDISYSIGLTNVSSFIYELVSDNSVLNIIHPFSQIKKHSKLKYDPDEPAIHVEIKQ